MHLREMATQSNAALGSLWLAIWGVLFNRYRGATGSSKTDPGRVHLFVGHFASEQALFAYCFTPVTPNGPEQLNLDLPEAPVDTSLIDAAFGDEIDRRLTEYFNPKQRARIRRRAGGARALVMVPTQSFQGLDFRLHDTPHLRHIGFEESLAPSLWALPQ